MYICTADAKHATKIEIERYIRKQGTTMLIIKEIVSFFMIMQYISTKCWQDKTLALVHLEGKTS